MLKRKKVVNEPAQKSEQTGQATCSQSKALALAKKIVLAIAFLVLVFVAAQIVNAEKYQAVVRVVSEAGKIGVNPTTERLDFGDLAKNASAVRYVTVSNGGGLKSSVMVLKFGGVSDLIKIDPARFVLNPKQSQRIRFEMFMPPSASKERYGGWVFIIKVPVF